MNPGQSLLIRRTFRVLCWLCLAWLLVLATVTGWGSWKGSSPREYLLDQPTTRARAVRTLHETATNLGSPSAWYFWGPLALGFAAYWTRRFLALGEGSEAKAEPAEREG